MTDEAQREVEGTITRSPVPPPSPGPTNAVASKPKAVRRSRLETWLRRNDHRRLADLYGGRHPWWDWGHRLMVVVGQDDCGNWSEPTPSTWYYRLGTGKRMWHTGYPIHPVSSIEVIKDYNKFVERTRGLNEDEMYGWKAICVDQDGDLRLGKQYWGGNFYGMNEWEMRLLQKYLRYWRRLDWWGARSWLYRLGLEAAVHRRKPRSCQAVPPKGSGGYSHWYCSRKRRHDGPHRFRNYEWSDGDQVQHAPSAPW